MHRLVWIAASLSLTTGGLGCAAGANERLGVNPEPCTGDNCPESPAENDTFSVAADVPTGCEDPCECTRALAPQSSQAKPAALMFAIDVSQSMDNAFSGSGGQTRWKALSNALTQVLPSLEAQDFQLGAYTFPDASNFFGLNLNGQCAVRDSPQAPITGSATAVLNALPPGPIFPSHTPMASALNRVRNYMSGFDNDGRPEAVVLVTDGEPTCNESAASVISEIAALRQDNILTAVLSIDNPHSQNLSNFAAEGALSSTDPRGYYLAQNPDTLLEAMRTISNLATQCEFEMDIELPEGWDVGRISLGSRDIDASDYEATRLPSGKWQIKLTDALCQELAQNGDLPEVKARFQAPGCTDPGALI